QDILCAVNVQHNCANNSCNLSGTRIVQEERKKTNKTLPCTKHFNLDDRLLNTNQMRSAIYLQ
ncbi:hypothetical protein BT96DRAFT_749847, partial [Gymnopus androsaceus JB14]